MKEADRMAVTELGRAGEKKIRINMFEVIRIVNVSLLRRDTYLLSASAMVKFWILQKSKYDSYKEKAASVSILYPSSSAQVSLIRIHHIGEQAIL